MRRIVNAISDVGSIVLAALLLAFFLGRPGYQPTGEYGILWGVGVVLAIAIIYIILEGVTVLSDKTPSPFYVAVETMFSYVPLMALVWVLAAWKYGATTLSPFQWIVFFVALFVILVDLIGFVTIVARQLLLTDEVKGIR